MNFLTASVDVKVDDSRLSSQLAKAKRAVTKTVDKIKASFGKMAASFKAAFNKMVRYAKLGALAIAGAFVLVVRAAMKQQDVVERLNITLKATGHAAGLSKNELLKQAAAIQKVTRYGDESIIALQTMLLTFKSIRGDEFRRATEAALDMATAEAAVSGRAVDLTAVSIRLGKALNDPLLGLTALSRVGVQFTEEQKSLIETLVKTGKTAEAQRVILKELEAQFGGMSRDVNTASGALKQMWNALGDVAEMIGAAFLPGIQDSAKAVKEWAEKNQEGIGRWAETFVAYMAYVKDILWSFVKFLRTDWRAGIKAGLGFSLEIFKGFGKSLVVLMIDVASRAWRAFVKEFSEGLGKWLIEASQPKGVLGKVLAVTPIGMAKRLAMIKAGKGLIEGARAIEPPEGPTTGKKLKEVWEDVGASIREIAPPELGAAFDESFEKLKERLTEIGTVAEEIEEPMERALVKVPEKATKVMDDAAAKMRQWSFDARNFWSNLSDVAVGALDGMSDALANLVLKGKADFNALAESILMDLTRMIIKAQMAQALGMLLPGLFTPMAAGAGIAGGAGAVPAPGLQHGGEVKKTGLAVVHKGEKWSGVPEGKTKQEGITLNMNVNAIDAAGTYQFLTKNKRAIATMMQGMLTANHTLRRTKGWK